MNIEQLKFNLCDTIDAAYLTAREEGHDEIMQPFTILIKDDGEVEYLPLGERKRVYTLS